MNRGSRRRQSRERQAESSGAFRSLPVKKHPEPAGPTTAEAETPKDALSSRWGADMEGYKERQDKRIGCKSAANCRGVGSEPVLES